MFKLGLIIRRTGFNCESNQRSNRVKLWVKQGRIMNDHGQLMGRTQSTFMFQIGLIKMRSVKPRANQGQIVGRTASRKWNRVESVVKQRRIVDRTSAILG